MHNIHPDTLLLAKLLLAHTLTDFVFQTKKSIERKNTKLWALLWHGLFTALVATALFATSGYQGGAFYLFVLTLCSHTLIDWAKINLTPKYTEKKQHTQLFFADQAAHIAVILFFWSTFTQDAGYLGTLIIDFLNSKGIITLFGLIFLTQPAALIIGEIIKNYKFEGSEPAKVTLEQGKVSTEGSAGTQGLLKAGFLIGIVERIIIFTLVLHNQYTAIGFLVAAKSILRISDKDRNITGKTEYLIIGTLLSFGMAIVVGEAVKMIN